VDGTTASFEYKDVQTNVRETVRAKVQMVKYRYDLVVSSGAPHSIRVSGARGTMFC
jgi:hypothetical protein